MNSIRRKWTGAVWISSLTLLVLACAPLDAALAQGAYRVVVLSGPNGESSYAYGINASGQVVGASLNAADNGDATIWSGSGSMTLAPWGTYPYSFGEGINRSGQVIGFSVDAGGTSPQATIWDSLGATPLTNLTGLSWSYGLAINDIGQVVGYCQDPTGAVNQATVWNSGIPTALDPLPGAKADATYALAINDAGQIAGFASDPEGGIRAVVWNGTTPTALSTSKYGSNAYGINNAGQIVGLTAVSGAASIATLWDGTTTTKLGTLGGLNSYAYAINSAGQVVGTSQTANLSDGFHAALWENGKIIDLNQAVGAALGPYLTLTWATAINDRGWIVGYGYDSQTALTVAYVLIPVSGGSS